MTTRCALHMGALKIFESPWVRQQLRNFKWAFVLIDHMNEVRSFTRSRDNRGYSKKFTQSVDMPTLPGRRVARICIRGGHDDRGTEGPERGAEVRRCGAPRGVGRGAVAPPQYGGMGARPQKFF